MSRIGVKPIIIPEGVTVTTTPHAVMVKGSKGELNQSIPKGIILEQKDNQIHVKRKNEDRQTKAFHGLVRSLINNMIIGVSQGYTKKLELVGTGYRAKKQGSHLVLNVGYSNPVQYETPEGVVIDIEGDTIVTIAGIDKQKVGHAAAEIRSIRKPEPYKGKGIRYQGEIIRRKAGKSTKVGSAA